MPKASSIQPDKNVSMLFKSPPGFGKTIAACSFAIYGPVYLAYFDKRTPIEVLTFFKKHRPELLDLIEYESFSSSNANEYLNRMIQFTRDCRYVAVITDSVTSLTSAAVNWSMGFRQPGGKKDGKTSNPSVVPDFDEYKVETSLVTQALDIAKTLPVFNIWTAHPLPQLRVTGSGSSMSVTSTSSLVSYGNKVGALVPGQFTEIYHFGRSMNSRIVWTDMVGDDYAKSSLGLPQQLDITDKLFAEVWRDAVKQSMEVPPDEVKETETTKFTLPKF
jgi:hypothetical protein